MAQRLGSTSNGKHLLQTVPAAFESRAICGRASPPSPSSGTHMTIQDVLQAMKLKDLKSKTPTDLLAFAEELEIENASSMRKQDMLFAILKELADRNVEITGEGVVETLQDGFGFLRSPESNYLPGPDDIYV